MAVNEGFELTPFESGVFTISRLQLARLSALEYVRSFWWFIGVIPLFGFIAIAFTSGLMQVIGVFAVLWPFTIPARAILTTTKSSRLFTGGCKLIAHDDRLEFQGQSPLKNGKYPRMILSFGDIRDVIPRKNYLLVRTIRLGMLPIPNEALVPGQAAALSEVGLKQIH